VSSRQAWRTSQLDLHNSQLSLDILLTMLTEKDFRDIEFCKRLIKRALDERNLKALKTILDNISGVFILSTKEFRKEIVEHLYSEINSWNFDMLIDIGKESVLGNVTIIYYFLKKVVVITPENLEMFIELAKLAHIEDPLIFDLVHTQDFLYLNLNERVSSLGNKSTIEKAIELCELFFTNDRLEKSKDTIHGMLLLYENSGRPEQKFKGNIVSALLMKKLNVLLALIKKVYKNAKDITSLIQHSTEIYNLLLQSRVPVFFNFNNLILDSDKIYNDNFYFVRFLDDSGNEKILLPFEQLDARQVQQIFDLETETFVTPRERIGKILLHQIYSFRKVREITMVPNEQVDIIKQMTENQIEEKIRRILCDKNITAHGPAEKTDVYPNKLFVNNENDIRDVAIILKGKGYPKISLRDVASNIIKAVDLPVQIVILIYTGILLDEAREKFVNLCNKYKKMYSLVDPIDLTKLLVAYDCFPTNQGV
jgi:hypothetical protein